MGKEGKSRLIFTVPPEIRAKVPHGEIFNRARAAEYLGLTVAELRRREQDGIYPMHIDRRGWHWFSEAELKALFSNGISKAVKGFPEVKYKPLGEQLKKPEKRSASTESGAQDDSEDAKKIFAEMKKGTHPTDIVLDLGLSPHVVRRVTAIWREMREQIVFTDAQRIDLEKLPLQGEFPVRSSEHLLEMLKKTFATPTLCGRCGKGKARICVDCASALRPQSAAAPVSPPLPVPPSPPEPPEPPIPPAPPSEEENAA